MDNLNGVVALISCHSFACHDTVMFTQVVVDAVSSSNNRLFVGVTSIPHERLEMMKYTGDLGDDVVIFPRVVYHRGEYVSM